MKNKIMKICSVLLTLAIMASMVTIVFADEITVPKPTTYTDGGFNTTIGKLLGFIQFIGYAFAVGMIIYIGIKYMMSSANEKADLKKGAINYVIGAVLVFAASAVVGIIGNIATGNISESTT